ncbi:MAG: zinc-dependent metalloprotease family protein, partial [Thermoproteota archaeon]
MQSTNPVNNSYVKTAVPSIDLEKCSWDHASINILLIPNSSSWFDEKYLVFTRLAIDSWKASINAYTNAYGSSYLNKITFNVFVLGVNSSSHYDIYVRFYKDITDGIAGLTDYRYYEDSGKLVNVTITIASEVYGEKLSYTQIRNVVAHEIGHSLGLGHALQKDTINGLELMYYAFDLSSTVQDTIYPSTLDIYALSVIYKWLETGIYESVTASSVSLPGNIPYKEAVYFRLTLINAYGSTVTSGWYLFESYVYISVNETYEMNSTFRYRFLRWLGKGSGSYSGSSRSFYIKITGDVSEEA